MPLLEAGISKVPFLKNITSQKVDKPGFTADDFTAGFRISEYELGQSKDGGANDVILKGPFMPHVPFTFGGKQRIVKEYYPGNSEPTVQIMGPEEDDLTIKGELRLKKFKRVYTKSTDDTGAPQLSEAQVRQVAQEYQELIDAMRIRGNLVELTMGEWHRWGFISSVQFEMHHLAKIEYTITFAIVGFNQPKNTKLAKGYDDNLIAPNKNITNAALKAINEMKQFPTEMPRTISEFLNQQISKVAGAIGLVTGFVNEALSDAEQLQASVNRAIGLVRNARATISSSARRLNQIINSATNLGSTVSAEWQKTAATVKSVNHISQMRYNYGNLNGYLADLEAQLSALRKTVPDRRYLVVTGDTLQKISNKFYNTPERWQLIYDHNKLTSTQLVVGSVLEIPKV